MSLVAVAVLAGCPDSSRRTASDGRIVLTDGRPAVGFLVTVTPQAGGRSTSVPTDASGGFQLPRLDRGPVTLSVRNDSGSLTTRFDTRIPLPAELELAVGHRPPPPTEVPSWSLLATVPEGPEKRQLLLDCAGCHQLDATVLFDGDRPRNKQQWREWVDQMIDFSGPRSDYPVMTPSRSPDETADWLARQFVSWPELPVPTRDLDVTGFADAVVTEIDLPHATEVPHDLLLADDELVVTGANHGVLYRLNTRKLTWTETALPGRLPNPRAVARVDDSLWVLLGFSESVAQLDDDGRWTSSELGVYGHSLESDGRGGLWFEGHFSRDPEVIGRVDTTTGAVTTWSVPVPPMDDGGSNLPSGLRVGPDGTIWMTELRGNRLVHFDPSSETFDIRDLPTESTGPRRLDVAPDGTVWIPGFLRNTLVRFDPTVGLFDEVALPIPDALPYVVRVDPDTGRVWVGTAAADAILRFDPERRSFDVYPLPTRGAFVRHLVIDPDSGAAWASYSPSPPRVPRVVRVLPRDD